MGGYNLTIRKRKPEDDAQIVAIFHAINHDSAPLTVDEYRHGLESVPDEAGLRVLVAEVDGTAVGEADWSKRLYTTEEGSFWCDIAVHPLHRRRGTGTALYERCLADVRDRRAARVFTSIREDLPEAQQFADERGFERTGFGNKRSRLEVRSANLQRCRDAAERVSGTGITIRSLADLNPDEGMLRAICDMDNASARAIPSSEEWKPMPFDQWRTYILGAPGYTPDAFFIAFDGDRPVGLAFLERRAGTFADNGYTGVHPEYHGRGIARALKLRTVEWAQANGIEYIATGNDVNNKPMLAINVEMGYQPLPARIELVKTL